MAIDGVSVAKLVFYLVLAPISFFCLLRHGKRGFLGWSYLSVLCGLRIATGAYGIHGVGTGLVSVILNCIGLSPLMLACAGLLHEARRTCIPGINRRLELFLDIQYHLNVGGGMALIVVAVAYLESLKHVSTMEIILKVGSAISAFNWGLLILWAVWSAKTFHGLKRSFGGRLVGYGTELVYAVLVAIPFLGIRLGYAIAFLLLKIQSPNSGFLTSTAVQVCLSFLPELAVVMVLTFVGIRTRGMKHEARKTGLNEGSDSAEEVFERERR